MADESFIVQGSLLPRMHRRKMLRLIRHYEQFWPQYNAKYLQLIADGWELFDPATKWFEVAPETLATYMDNGNEWLAPWLDNWFGPDPDGGHDQAFDFSGFAGADIPDNDQDGKWIQRRSEIVHGDFALAGGGMRWFQSLILMRMFTLRAAMELEQLISLDNRGRPLNVV